MAQSLEAAGRRDVPVLPVRTLRVGFPAHEIQNHQAEVLPVPLAPDENRQAAGDATDGSADGSADASAVTVITFIGG